MKWKVRLDNHCSYEASLHCFSDCNHRIPWRLVLGREPLIVSPFWNLTPIGLWKLTEAIDPNFARKPLKRQQQVDVLSTAGQVCCHVLWSEKSPKHLRTIKAVMHFCMCVVLHLDLLLRDIRDGIPLWHTRQPICLARLLVSAIPSTSAIAQCSTHLKYRTRRMKNTSSAYPLNVRVCDPCTAKWRHIDADVAIAVVLLIVFAEQLHQPQAT